MIHRAEKAYAEYAAATKKYVDAGGTLMIAENEAINAQQQNFAKKQALLKQKSNEKKLAAQENKKTAPNPSRHTSLFPWKMPTSKC